MLVHTWSFRPIEVNHVRLIMVAIIMVVIVVVVIVMVAIIMVVIVMVVIIVVVIVVVWALMGIVVIMFSCWMNYDIETNRWSSY